jgi:hypothetical protein
LFLKKHLEASPWESSKSCGLGLIWLLGTGVFQWLTNGKVHCVNTTWGLIVTMLLLNRMLLLKGKARAYNNGLCIDFICDYFGLNPA